MTEIQVLKTGQSSFVKQFVYVRLCVECTNACVYVRACVWKISKFYGYLVRLNVSKKVVNDKNKIKE